MQFDEVLRRRRMVRHYTDEPVDPDDLDALVAAGLRAPSAGFAQGFRLLVLTEEGDRRRFWSCSDWEPPDERRGQTAARMREAPVLIVPLCSKAAYVGRYSEPDKTGSGYAEESWPVPYWYVDAAFATMLILLEAVDLDLGAAFVGSTPGHTERLREAFGVPGDFEAIGVILVGHRHPDVGPAYRRDRRRPREEMVFQGRWRVGDPGGRASERGSAGPAGAGPATRRAD